jgi:thiol-disulfide isomerase/thioredoxin
MAQLGKLPKWFWPLVILPIFFWMALPTRPQAPSKNLIGQPAPEIEALDEKGAKVRLSELKGNTVLLNFWASWCLPCVEEFESLRQLEKRLEGKPFRLVLVNVGESVTEAQENLRFEDIPGLSLFGASIPQIESYGFEAVPTTFLISPDGTIRNNYFGGYNWLEASFLNDIEAASKHR